MKLFTHVVMIVTFLLLAQAVTAAPVIQYQELALAAEEDFQVYLEAKNAAIAQGLPVSIYLPEGIHIQALGMEDGEVVYGIVTDLAQPFQSGSTAFYEEVARRYDLRQARLHYGNGRVVNEAVGMPRPTRKFQRSLLLMPESTADRVLAFDPVTGDLVDDNFIPPQPSGGPLSTPIAAQQTPWGTITISDQLTDAVQEFDTSGTYLGLFAPAGGVNTAIMDNIRGHIYRANGNLLVTVAAGANINSVAEFDQSGNYLGNFIANGAGGLDSPWDVLFRANDILVTGGNSDAVHRYDLNGTYIDNLVSGINFPEQVAELQNGNIAVAGFSAPAGIYIYSATGSPVSYFSTVTGPRGVYGLENGNLMATNGSGVFELNATTGAIIRTIVSGVSARFVTPYQETSQIPDKVLISEFVVTPTQAEFVEIYNAGLNPVDLSDYYLTDATYVTGGEYYYNIVTGANYGGGSVADFHARFPAGAVIQPGEYQTIAMNGNDFVTTYGIQPTYELWDTNAGISDMREAAPGSINNQGGLTNSDEVIILYYWDGLSDLVSDVDYVLYNSGSPVANNEAVDKTGIWIDGPDPGTDSTQYLPDTPIASQRSAINHGTGYSVHRIDYTEGTQIASGGNGLFGSDETSENLDQTFSNNSLPSPNAAWTPAQTARVQIVHNAADPAVELVDVYLNGTRVLDDFAFRTATPFLTFPAGMVVNIGIAPGTSTSVADTIKNFAVDFAQNGLYIGFATGVVDPMGFAPNPDGEDISFTIFGQDFARLQSQTPGSVDLFVMHGVTDAETIDIHERTAGLLFDNLGYGDVTSYITIPTGSYILDVKDSTGTEILASFEADLTSLADSALGIFASGFSEPDQNQNGPQAGLFAVLPSGTVIELPVVNNIARVQFIHNAPDPALESVDVYVEDVLFLDNFTFRSAAPFNDFPAGQEFMVGLAPGTSTSVLDTIKSFVAFFPPNATLIGLISGVLNPAGFAPNPDGADISLDVFGTDNGREVSSTPGQVEFFVYHGATDAPAVDVVVQGVGTVFQNVSYSDATDYLAVAPASYIVELYDSTGAALLKSYNANISGLADSAITIFASGFLNPAANQNGPAFGLYAALADGQVIMLPEVLVSIGDIPDLIPKEYALHQNYPNPFNPVTTIKYDLKQASEVSLKIYNLLGQEVRTLVNQSQEAGYQSVMWDGRNNLGAAVASGIYIYRLEAGDFVSTRKMILMK